jgi:ABC-type Zn uptake system ZnuABC Zn-binding protein ZnuA
MRRGLGWLAGLALVLASCGPGGPSGSAGDGRLPVIATSSVFADLVRNVGGDLVTVSSLVPPNSDVHTYSPKPSDVRALAGARVVFMNGLGLDDWLNRTIGSVANHAPVVQLAVDLPGATLQAGEDPNGPANPHLWLNVAYAQGYVDRIAASLAQADPPHAAAYADQAKAYRARLGDLDAWVRQQIATIPAPNRRIVALHDAFPYFAAAYGLEIVGVAVAAPGQDPNAAYTAALIDAIRAKHVTAIFSEAQFPPKFVEQLAQEAGVTVVATLYDDSIGDAPLTTYEAVIRWDTEQFVKALA